MTSTVKGVGRATLREMDGLPFHNNSARLPHPVELSIWSAAGLYLIDADNGCFRLTEAARASLLNKEGE